MHRVVGPRLALEAFAKALARRPLPDDWSHWGAVALGGVDHRIRTPATICELGVPSRARTLRRMLLDEVSATDMLDLLGADSLEHREATLLERGRRLLARFGLQELDLELSTASSDPSTRALLSLAAAVATDPPIVLVFADAPGFGDARVMAGLRSVAARTMLIVLDSEPTAEAEAPSVRLVGAGPGAAVPAVPAWFRWVDWQRLGGMGRPGLIEDDGQVREGLQQLDLDLCVGLEEESYQEWFRGLRTRYEHFPIVDMEAPSVPAAARLARRVGEHIADGAKVAFHCKAGLGRTGTMLAAVLVAQGYRSDQALALLRLLHPQYLQTESQEACLAALEVELRG